MATVDEVAKPVAKRFGQNLAGERKSKEGMTQEALADLAEVHRSEIALLEAGQRQPRLTTLIKLAGALEVEPAKLLAGINWKPAQRETGRFQVD